MTALRLIPNGPFDHEIALRMLAAHAIPGAEYVDLGRSSHTRLLPTPAGPVRVDVIFTADAVTAHIPDETPDTGSIATTIRRWLDLDADTALIAASFRDDPIMGPLAERRPGIRLIGYPDEFEAVVATIIGQQVSLAAARTFAGRLVAAYGTPVAGLRAFPNPHELAAVPAEQLQATVGLTGARTRTLRTVAEEWASGFTLQGLGVDDGRRALLTLPGIGPWTADCLAVRALQHPDTFAPSDLVARSALGDATIERATRLSASWAPWRSYALVHLWAEVAYGTSQHLPPHG